MELGAKLLRKIKKLKPLSLKVKSLLLYSAVVVFPTIFFGSLILFETNDILREQSIDYTTSRLNTIEDNLTATIQDVEDISTYIIFSDDFRKFMTSPPEMKESNRHEELEQDLKGFFTFHLLSKNYINSISVEGLNHNELFMGDPVLAKETTWEKRAEKAEGKIVWSTAYPIHSYWSGDVNVISMFRVINDINDINRKIGLIKIRLNENVLYDFVNQGVQEDTGSTFILDQDGNVVLHENEKLYGKKYPDEKLLNKIEKSSKSKSFAYSFNDKEYLVASREVERTGWRLITMVDERAILKELKGIGYWVIFFLTLSIVLGIILLVGFYITIIHPIIDLTNKTRQVEHGDFSVFVNVKSHDEIGKLGHRFNQMVKTIQQLINTKYKLEIKQRESELKALQHQIDPHFLYNTLDMIRWTARLENALETSRLIEHLSKMFRIRLSKGKVWIPLKEELAYVEHYLELQKKRLGDKVAYTLEVDEQIEDSLVLKQILQPLVENSIVHGFKFTKGNGQITIQGYKDGNNIIIDVIDDGVGLNAQKMNESLEVDSINENNGFALSNINERITAAFGTGYGLSFLEYEHGAWIRVSFPMITNINE